MRHTETVRAAVEARHDHSPNTLSWRRCVVLHGLDPEQLPKQLSERAVVDAQALAAARERAQPLVTAARPDLDRLAAAFGRSGCCLVLTDETGTILEQRGTRADEDSFRALGLMQGARWDEAHKGTNGIGTALAEGQAVGIYRDQHFLTAFAELSCATAPIRDHRGRLAGAFDISSARRDMNKALLGVYLHAAQEAAFHVEVRLFRAAYPTARIVLTPEHRAPRGLLALDQDDIVIGANAAARHALSIDDAWIAAGHPAWSVLQGEGRAQNDSFDAAERRAIRAALAQAGGRVSGAAKILGVSRATLHRKIKRLSIKYN
ncbi:MAG: helix-turn-helix domain-containing protein [Pseudomonadota bacterium]